MSELTKTRAFVLKKIDFGDTSKIAQFYTEDFGKISAIVKGARTPNSRIGKLIDTFNHLQIILYKKENRDIQLISDVDLIDHYLTIKEDFDRMKYSNAVLELISYLTVEHDHNSRLYKGSIRIFELLNDCNRDPHLNFAKYFIFFIKEIGYEFPVNRCSICGKVLKGNNSVSYNFENGIMCFDCKKDRLVNIDFSEELFNLLFCLSTKKNDIKYSKKNIEQIIILLEKFIKYNIPEFKGLRSLELK